MAGVKKPVACSPEEEMLGMDQSYRAPWVREELGLHPGSKGTHWKRSKWVNNLNRF